LDDIADNDEKQEEYDIFLKKFEIIDETLWNNNLGVKKGMQLVFY
jgi:hypothetical protein